MLGTPHKSGTSPVRAADRIRDLIATHRKMAKRSGLLRRGAKPHGPGGAGGYEKSKSAISAKKIKKRLKIKGVKSAVAAAVSSDSSRKMREAASSSQHAPNDLFALALPTAPPDESRFALAAADADEEMIERKPAFAEDESKEALFRRILSQATQGSKDKKPAMIPADAHRARVNELKQRKANRAAMKAERFAPLHLYTPRARSSHSTLLLPHSTPGLRGMKSADETRRLYITNN